MEAELLTVDELAAMLKVPRSWVYQHSRGRNPLPFIKVGKYLRLTGTHSGTHMQRCSENSGSRLKWLRQSSVTPILKRRWEPARIRFPNRSGRLRNGWRD